MSEFGDQVKELVPDWRTIRFAYYTAGFGAMALIGAITDIVGNPVTTNELAAFGLLALAIAILSLRIDRSEEERKQYAIEAEPTTFTVESEQEDGTPLVELVEETATGDGDEWYFTERDAAAMAETILDEIDPDAGHGGIDDD